MKRGKVRETSPGRYELWFGRTHLRFRDEELAKAKLDKLRVDHYEGTFDKRDYQRDKPLGFANLANKWLGIRKTEVRSFNALSLHIRYACNFFEQHNVKAIGYSELEDFLLSLPQTLSNKSKANIFTSTHALFNWISKREKIPLPEFPKIKYELKRRKTITHEQQQEILAWLKENAPFKVWLGIKWLMTYISIRPGELINIKEGDIDREQGVLYVKDNKSKRIKSIPLLKGDISFIRERALPHVYFFRHKQRKGVATYQRFRFGKRCLYTWWKRACISLGIRDVDLYGGTRHSSAQYLRLQGRTPEEIKKATMHETSRAFDRYFNMDLEDLRRIYGTGKVIEMKERREG